VKLDVTTAREQVIEELRVGEKFLLTTHENPDGDALGSLVAMHEILNLMGKDNVMFMSAEEFPLPYEYRDLPLGDVNHELPDDAEERTIVFLDCGNIDRMPVSFLRRDDAHILNIDHHHDNTNFGTANLVVGSASCTAEIVYGLTRDLGVEVTQPVAEALYVALVTDTGRFQYANTTPKSLRLAAELVEAGVDVHRVFQGIFESVPFAKLKLLAKAFERAELFEGGRLVVTHLLRSDFTEVGVGEEYAEGLIDYLRQVDGTEMAATIREPPEPLGADRRISMRASHDELDVSAIARKRGGGGHRQAAGFSSSEPIDEIKAFLREEFRLATARA
jgi:bifunctional oligoribonuclease and PAP phosphatase NrnA